MARRIQAKWITYLSAKRVVQEEYRFVIHFLILVAMNVIDCSSGCQYCSRMKILTSKLLSSMLLILTKVLYIYYICFKITLVSFRFSVQLQL